MPGSPELRAAIDKALAASPHGELGAETIPVPMGPRIRVRPVLPYREGFARSYWDGQGMSTPRVRAAWNGQ